MRDRAVQAMSSTSEPVGLVRSKPPARLRMPPTTLPGSSRTSRVMAGLVVVLAVLLSGAPRGLAVIITGDVEHCSVPCGAADRDDDCSPVCTTGPCAKLSVAAPGISVVALQPLELVDAGVEQAEPVSADVRSPPAGIASSIFHPPRA